MQPGAAPSADSSDRSISGAISQLRLLISLRFPKRLTARVPSRSGGGEILITVVIKADDKTSRGKAVCWPPDSGLGEGGPAGPPQDFIWPAARSKAWRSFSLEAVSQLQPATWSRCKRHVSLCVVLVAKKTGVELVGRFKLHHSFLKLVGVFGPARISKTQPGPRTEKSGDPSVRRPAFFYELPFLGFKKEEEARPLG